MKTRYFTLLLLLLTITSFGQRRFGEKREQIKSLKVAFITDELKLTTVEAEKFWPLYNAFDAKQTELRRQKVRTYLDRPDDASVDKLSDKEAASLLQQMEDNQDDIYQNRKKFVASLKGVLPAAKIIRLMQAEEDFNRKLLKQYRDKSR